MVWSRSRHGLLISILLGTAIALFLLIGKSNKGDLRRVYDGIKIGMEQGNVRAKLDVYGAYFWDGQAWRPVGNVAMQNCPHWVIGLKRPSEEVIYVWFDSEMRVSNKWYDSGINLRLRRWYYDMRPWLHW